MKHIVLALVLLSSVAFADPPLGPSLTVTDGTTTLNNTHKVQFTAGCTQTNSGSTAQENCTGGGVPTTRAINTTLPLTGGGTLAADLTLACPTCLTGSPAATGDLMYSTSGGQAFSRLPDVATGQYVKSGGVGAAPVYGTISNGDLPGSGAMTINTTSPLGGGGSVSLGGSLTLTCTTCVIQGTNTLTTAITVKDSVAGLSGDLLLVENNGATVKYLDITDNSSNLLTSGAADGVTPGNIYDCANAFGGTHFCHLLRNGGTDYIRMDGAGNWRVNVAANGAGITNAGNTMSLFPAAGGFAIFAGNFQPNTDSNITYLIGTATKRWARAYFHGTALVSGDFALGAGFGNTASVGTISASDDGGTFVITASGTGLAANPTWTLTFHDGTWTNAPNCWSKLEATTSVALTISAVQATEAPTATTLVGTLNSSGIAPSSNDTFTVRFGCVGM